MRRWCFSGDSSGDTPSVSLIHGRSAGPRWFWKTQSVQKVSRGGSFRWSHHVSLGWTAQTCPPCDPLTTLSEQWDGGVNTLNCVTQWSNTHSVDALETRAAGDEGKFPDRSNSWWLWSWHQCWGVTGTETYGTCVVGGRSVWLWWWTTPSSPVWLTTSHFPSEFRPHQDVTLWLLTASLFGFFLSCDVNDEHFPHLGFCFFSFTLKQFQLLSYPSLLDLLTVCYFRSFYLL